MKDIGVWSKLMDPKSLQACERLLYTPISISRLILSAAKAGRTLPRLSIVLLLQLCIHIICVQLPTLPSNVKKTSLALLCLNASLNVAGYAFLVALYRWSVQTIFNRQIPPTIHECLASFGAHLSLLRPLEILFRYFTSSFRVLPDIIVLGEVRCGTTSLCQHLTKLENFDCHTPFCLWAHPELDNKESFYFVGHYLGNVTPKHYRMCFPLKVTKWWKEFLGRIRGQKPRPFLSFDGCAQFLSSPTAPYLIAEAYSDAGQPPPVLIACVRNPADQALSWWKYENSAMQWGESMLLGKWNTALRGTNYPPKTLKDAIQFSGSTDVKEMYNKAEQRVISDLRGCSTIRLPQWAMTWPGGQLSVFGRNSKFSKNVARYEKGFQCFSRSKIKGKDSSFQYVNIFPLEYLSDDILLKSFLVSILKRVATRASDNTAFEPAIAAFQKSMEKLSIVHRNAGLSVGTSAELLAIEPFFREDLKELNEMMKANNIRLHYKDN